MLWAPVTISVTAAEFIAAVGVDGALGSTAGVHQQVLEVQVVEAVPCQTQIIAYLCLPTVNLP